METVLGVITGEKEGDADGTETTELGVALLGVAEGLDKLLDGNRVLVPKAKRCCRRKAARMLECGRESKYSLT